MTEAAQHPKTAADVQTVEQIRQMLIDWLADALECSVDDVDPAAPFTSFGLDSIKAFSLTGDLTEWLDSDLPATLFWDHPSIEALTVYVAKEIGLDP